MAQGSCRTAYGIYTTLQTARFQAEDIFKRIDGFPDAKVPNKTLLKAQVRAYGGFALVALGEGFCQMALDGGPLMAPKDVLGLAETRFTDAITLATSANSSDILNMALVGRARVRLDLGNFAGAISLWEVICNADADDLEAHRKVRELAVNETLARRNYAGLAGE